MVSSSIFSFFILFTSFLHLGFSHQNASDPPHPNASELPHPNASELPHQNANDLLQSLSAMANDHTSVVCMQKLLPCQDFIKSPTHPPESCCSPLKEVFTHDTKCLCHYFDDPKTLQAVNVTKEDALKLPKACNLNPDLSVCKHDADAPAATPGGSKTENIPNISIAQTNEITPPPSSATKITCLGAASLIALAFAVC